MNKRKLPDWLLDEKIGIESKDDNSSRRYSLRSRSPKAEIEIKPTVEKLMPFIKYNGKVEYYTEMHDIAFACDTLLQWIETQKVDVIPIAFDMEWPFSFQTGSGKSAVIQLCANINLCYVLHISKLKKLPAVLLALLYHPKVRLHGVNIKNDFRKLERDFPETQSQKMIDQCVDLSTWCNEVIGSSGRWSMERLVLHICKLRINKDGKVRRSKWDVQPLSKEQQIYAAIDVYISQVIYYELEKRQKENEKKELEFLEKYGEEALAAIEKLA